MKRFTYIAVAFTMTVILFVASCSKKIEGSTDNTSALAPAQADANAGDWKTILLTSPTDVAVAAPARNYNA